MSTAPVQIEPDMQKFYVARFKLVSKYPFIARALYAMPIMIEPRCPTMGVDQYWWLYINPAFLNELELDELVGVLYHEVLHLLMNHHERADDLGIANAPSFDPAKPVQLNLPKVWNLAADCEINDNILDERFHLPDGHCIGDVFGYPRHLLAEQYYDLLREQFEKDLDQLLEQIKDFSGPLGGEDGSGAGGPKQDWEKDGPGGSSSQNGEGQDEQDYGLSSGSAEIIRQETAREIADQAQKQPGSVPGGMERWAEDRLQSKVDWRRHLRAAVRQGVALTTGAVDYYYDRPARRQSVFPRIILPRLRAPQPSIAMIIDTSGSMSEENLAQALAEIGGVLRAVNSPVDVISGDTGSMAVSKVLKPDQAKLVGGGGTDMGAILEELAQGRTRYGLVIVVTDGYTPWCEANPLDCPVLVVLVDPNTNGTAWATSIRACDV